MSLLLAGLICAGTSGAMVVGRWLARRRDGDGQGTGHVRADGPRADPKDDEATHPEDGGGSESVVAVGSGSAGAAADAPPMRPKARSPGVREAKAGMASSPPLAGFPCQLGDVILQITGEEAWLAGALVLSEEVPVAALFVAPDAGHDTAIYARPGPRSALFWLAPLDPAAVLVGGEAPNAVELRAMRFDRVRRLPLRVRRAGVGAPDVGDVVVVAEYVSAGSERLLVLKGNAGVRAWSGHELDASAFEVIPSGSATLD